MSRVLLYLLHKKEFQITKQLTLKNSGEHCTSFCRISFSFSSVILLSIEKSFSNGKKRKIEVPLNKECIHKVIQPFSSCNIIFWHANYSTYSSLLTFLNNSNRTTHYKKNNLHNNLITISPLKKVQLRNMTIIISDKV